MPELPEVETIRAGLSRLLPGRTFAAVSGDTPKSFPNAPTDVERFLVGATVVEVRRRAKVLLIELSSKYSLVIHLKMTGQLVFISGSAASSRLRLSGMPDAAEKRTEPYRGTGQGVSKAATQQSAKSGGRVLGSAQKQAATAQLVRFGGGHPSDSLIHELPDKSTRVVFDFTDGSKLFFNDQRKFGWVKLTPTAEVPNIDFMQRVGPEPLEADFTWQVLKDRLKRRAKTSIKAAILDQSVVAGIGNIYADESLWGAKIHPATRVADLSDKNMRDLHKSMQEILRLAIDKGGSTDHTYVDAEGKKGSYLNFARVFRREGQACPRCGTTIEKIRVAGRGTHICPHEQKLR